MLNAVREHHLCACVYCAFIVSRGDERVFVVSHESLFLLWGGGGGGNAECGSLNTSSNASKCIAFCSRPLCMAKEGKGESEMPDQVALSNDAFRVLCLSVSVTWTSQIPASCCACCR